MSSRTVSGHLSNYARLRTLPALLSVAFFVASLYQFGGIATVELTWIDYTLASEHATILSLGIYAAAFASSETKQLDNYADWEMIVIAAGPVIILAHQYVGFVADEFAANDPLLPVIGFAISVAAWGVAVR